MWVWRSRKICNLDRAGLSDKDMDRVAEPKKGEEVF